jgi:hypothetical protein
MRNNPNSADQVRKAKHHRFRHEWKGWTILIGCLCVLAVFILLAMTTDFMTSFYSHRSAKNEMKTTDSKSMYSGAIVLEKSENQCEFRQFDNESGRMIVDIIKRCKAPDVLDSHGVPRPMGTIHRLDAISRSFGGAH